MDRHRQKRIEIDTKIDLETDKNRLTQIEFFDVRGFESARRLLEAGNWN